MKTFDMGAMPALPGSNQVTDAEALKNLGANTSAFAIHNGDVIAFDVADEAGNPVVYSRPVRPKEADSPLAYYVAVTRNGKASWVAIGGLTRRNFSGAYTCDVCAELATEPSFVEMFQNKLRDKSLKCTAIESQEFASFTNGKRDETPVKRQTPILAWA